MPGSPDEFETLRLDPGAAGEQITIVVVTRDGKIEHALERGTSCVLGRSEASEVCIPDPSISRQHVRLTHTEAGTIVVEDLGSANGTRVGPKVLGRGEASELVRGDVLDLGAVFVVVDRVGMHGGDAEKSSAKRPPSSSMDALHALVARVAKSNLSVLVFGETGAGKDVLAEKLHALSPRAGKPMLRLNCAALSEQLLESELFGHERGAFTGALQAKPGLLETADTGTVFLDELGELPLSLQAKLLRVLEDRKVMRVGAVRAKEIDVRFVAATNRDLRAEIAAGRFRQDLYFRLNGISIVIPPLRERTGEIEKLAHGFIAAAAKGQGRKPPALSPKALRALEAYPWPGNVRELRNVVERAVVLCDRDVLDVDDLVLEPGAPNAEESGSGGSLREDVDALEHRRILDALAACDGNQTRAAKMLGISRGTLVSRLERFGVARPRKKG